MILKREITSEILKHFKKIPVTAIIGARQVGKSTLAKDILSHFKSYIYLDLELAKNRTILQEPYLFFKENKDKIICIDEIQIMPHLFSEIKGFVDEYPKTKFLILGSSSPDLLRKTSETMAGRIFYYELTPFLWNEIKNKYSLKNHWLKGGLPKSLLSSNAYSKEWRKNYIKTFLERDIRQLGFNIPSENLRRIWLMLAHINGQILNYSQLANSIGMTSPSVKNYIDILEYTFMIRRLPTYFANISKRIIKSPKIYFRDTGILHALLDIYDFNTLYSHPIYGFSWESYVIENVIQKFKDYQPFYYRTSNGSEIDLLLVKDRKKIAIEIKASAQPQVSDGFKNAIDDLKVNKAFIIAQTSVKYAVNKNIIIYPFENFMSENIKI
jgi:predicted AAA+ superfamily ATPase